MPRHLYLGSDRQGWQLIRCWWESSTWKKSRCFLLKTNFFKKIDHLFRSLSSGFLGPPTYCSSSSKAALHGFESFCALMYNRRLVCLTLRHISAYVDRDLIDIRYSFAGQQDMLAQLGWAGIGNCSRFLNHRLYPVCRTAQPYAITKISCRSCVTPVPLSWCHFSFFLPWQIWYLL